MPLSPKEAEAILRICKEYISPDKVRDLFLKLDTEIGLTTDNQSLRQSLQAMRLLVDPPKLPAPWWIKFFFYILVVAHLLLVFGMAISFILLPIKVSWYIALPVMAFIFFFSTTRVECKLTELENYLRRRLGMKPIGGFVGYYIMRPVKKKILSKVRE